MRIPWFAFGLALILTVLLTPLVRKLAFKYGAVAYPRERDIHTAPLPRWGGLAMVGAFMITMGIVFITILKLRTVFPWTTLQLEQYVGILIAAAVVAVVGALDDKYDVSALWQTAALVAAGIILVAFHVRIEAVTNPFVAMHHTGSHHYDPKSWLQFPYWFSAFFTVLWVFGVAKTVDFIDGLDGLAAGVCAICAVTLAVMSAQVGQYEVTIIAAALVGVCLGFLRYNFNPASIIMGTVGAQFLGFVLAAIAVIGTFKIAATLSVALPVLVLGVPIFDGIRVVTQRALKKTPAYLPDKTSHLHHLLINRGLSQRKAVLIIYGLTACLCAVALLLFRVSNKEVSKTVTRPKAALQRKVTRVPPPAKKGIAVSLPAVGGPGGDRPGGGPVLK